MNLNELTSSLYQSLSEDGGPRKIEAWHASQLAQCPRSQYLSRLGVPSTGRATGAKILRWEAGHIIEGVIRPHLKKLYPNLLSNIRLVNKDLDLSGEFDNYDPDSGTIIEIKSVSSHAVKYRKVTDDRYHLKDERPYLHHELQQAAYVLLMREEGTHFVQQDEQLKLPDYLKIMKDAKEVSQIIYIYITLDGLLVPYSTSVNDEMVQKVAGRLTTLRKCWKTQVPPGCMCDLEDHPLYKSVMQYCPYRSGDKCCSLDLLTDKDKKDE